MANNFLGESLISALSYAAVPELPEEDKGENIWIKALALTTRKDGSQAYVALVRGKDGNSKIVKDFSITSAVIHKIEKVYPYLYLDGRVIPTFKDKNSKEDRIAWLQVNDGETDYSKCSLKELNKAIINVAAYNTVRNSK